MALADIEKKIIGDAEKEAVQIVARARTEQFERVTSVKKELSQRYSELNAQLQSRTALEAEQHKQLQKMDAAQKLLAAKRKALEELFSEVIKDILDDESRLVDFFKAVLTQSLPADNAVSIEVAAVHEKALKHALKDMKCAADVVLKKEWQPGRLEVVLTKARIDCSLALYVQEKGRQFEARIAQILFAGA